MFSLMRQVVAQKDLIEIIKRVTKHLARFRLNNDKQKNLINSLKRLVRQEDQKMK